MAFWRRTRPVAFVNGEVVTPEGSARSIRFAARVLDVGARARRDDVVIDLDGAFVLPGLINAHDHLELNHYGRIKFRDRYANATEWIDDMRPRLRHDAAIRAGQARPLADRLLIGALKNLLAGVTTVAHHNPLYREIASSPVQIVRKFGWAHSFRLEREPAGAHGERGGVVAERCARTPSSAPFFVHVAEGTDRTAAAEVDRLDEAGALRANAVLIHGVAISDGDWQRVVDRGARLVWCPASNHFLFGQTPPVGRWIAGGHLDRISLGTDSRITGSPDLLDEMRCAARHAGVDPGGALRMVTTNAAAAIRVRGAGRVVAGAPADLIVIPRLDDDPARALLAAVRGDVALVAIGGRPRIGDARMADVFAARGVSVRGLRVDERPKIADADLVRRIGRSTLQEPGLTW